MCSPAEFESMLRLVERTRMRPVVDSSRPMSELPHALQAMRDGVQTGKLVLVNEWSVEAMSPTAKL